MRRAILASLLAGTCATARAAPTVADAWARPASAGQTGVVYMTVTDIEPDTLTGAASPVAVRAELHRSQVVNGIVEMRPVDGIPVAPGSPAALAPGGYHLMLLNLSRPLTAGDRFPVTLTFGKAGEIVAEVTVRPGPANHDHMHIP